jgi:hypothetical protein
MEAAFIAAFFMAPLGLVYTISEVNKKTAASAVYCRFPKRGRAFSVNTLSKH